MGIVMLPSEKRSLFRFLAIYLSSTVSLFLLGTFIFYGFQKHQIIDKQNSELTLEAEKLTQQLRVLHGSFGKELHYPQTKNFQTAIYNLDKEYIFGTFNPKEVRWNREYYQKEGKLYYIRKIEPYYLGTAFAVVAQPLNQAPLNVLFNTSLLFLLVVTSLLTLLALFLGKLFIAPMRESIETMNKFIEDTTHELNTPISTILTNIELLSTLYRCEGEKEMQRIEMASQTLSRLYEDLTYLKFNHNYHRELVELNISALVEERIQLFHTLIEAKELRVEKELEESVLLTIDRNDAIRLIDNLLSNAIKYNQKKGLLAVKLSSTKLTVTNDGLGIKKEEIPLIRNRFRRANKSEGGFGIGLDIIAQVVKRYGFKFTIESNLHQKTKVTISW